jgi:hypothetical protein
MLSNSSSNYCVILECELGPLYQSPQILSRTVTRSAGIDISLLAHVVKYKYKCINVTNYVEYP